MRNPLVFLVLTLLTFAAVGCSMPSYAPADYAYDDYGIESHGLYGDDALYESADYEYNQYEGMSVSEIARAKSYAREKSSGRALEGTVTATLGGAGSTPETKKVYRDDSVDTNKADNEVDNQTGKAQLVSGEAIQQKLIYTGAFTIGVYDIELKKKELLKKVNELGGYLQSETNTQLEVRVPAEKFFEVVKIIEEVGRVLNKYVVTKDVTEKFYDIQKRLEVKKDALETLKEILKKTEKIEDVIALQREIRTLIEEIETLEGSMRVLQSLIRHSLITIDFRLEQSISKSGQSNKVRLPIPWLARHSLEQLLGLRLQQYQYTR